MTWQRWLVIVGGLLAIVGQFWGANYYFPLIGGAIAVIFSLLSD